MIEGVIVRVTLIENFGDRNENFVQVECRDPVDKLTSYYAHLAMKDAAAVAQSVIGRRVLLEIYGGLHRTYGLHFPLGLSPTVTPDHCVWCDVRLSPADEQNHGLPFANSPGCVPVGSRLCLALELGPLAIGPCTGRLNHVGDHACCQVEGVRVVKRWRTWS